MLRTYIHIMKVNGFNLAKKRSRKYPSKTITDVDYSDEITFLANTLAKDEALKHCRERAASSIGLDVNPNKTEYMCFNHRGGIYTRNASFQKLVGKFTCLGSSVSSTEKDINTRLAKAWTATYRLSDIRKSGLTERIKCSFFSIWMHYMDAN